MTLCRVLFRLAASVKHVNARGLRDHVPVVVKLQHYFVCGVAGKLCWYSDQMMDCLMGRFPKSRIMRDSFVSTVEEAVSKVKQWSQVGAQDSDCKWELLNSLVMECGKEFFQ